MGARKKISAEKRKEALKTMYLQNCKMFLPLRGNDVSWLT